MYGGHVQYNENRHIINVSLWEFYEAYSCKDKAIKLLKELCGKIDPRQSLEMLLSLKLTEKMYYTGFVLEELNDLFLSTIKANYTSLNTYLESTGTTTDKKNEFKNVDECFDTTGKAFDSDSTMGQPQLPADTLPAVASFVAFFDLLQSKLVGSKGVERLNNLKKKIAVTMLRPSASDDTQADSLSGNDVKQGDGIDLFSIFIQRCRDYLKGDYKRLFTEAHALSQAIVKGDNIDQAWFSYQARLDRWFPVAPDKNFLVFFDNSVYLRWDRQRTLKEQLVLSKDFKTIKQQQAEAFLVLLNSTPDDDAEVGEGRKVDTISKSGADSYGDAPSVGNKSLSQALKRFDDFFGTTSYDPKKLQCYQAVIIDFVMVVCRPTSLVLPTLDKEKLLLYIVSWVHTVSSDVDFKSHLEVLPNFLLSTPGQRSLEQVAELLKLFNLKLNKCSDLDKSSYTEVLIDVVRSICGNLLPETRRPFRKERSISQGSVQPIFLRENPFFDEESTKPLQSKESATLLDLESKSTESVNSVSIKTGQSSVDDGRALTQGALRPQSPVTIDELLQGDPQSVPGKLVPGYIDTVDSKVFFRLIQGSLLLHFRRNQGQNKFQNEGIALSITSEISHFLEKIGINLDLSLGKLESFFENLEENIVSGFLNAESCIEMYKVYQFADRKFVVSMNYEQNRKELITIFPNGKEQRRQINIASEELLAAAVDSETDLCSVTCVMI